MRVVGAAATLKGGLALELRLERARTTKDIDLRLQGSPDDVLTQLQEAGRLSLGDYMTFEVRPDPRHPDIKSDGMQYEGLRYRVECRLAGKVYGSIFGVDVAFGDPSRGPSHRQDGEGKEGPSSQRSHPARLHHHRGHRAAMTI